MTSPDIMPLHTDDQYRAICYMHDHIKDFTSWLVDNHLDIIMEYQNDNTS